MKRKRCPGCNKSRKQGGGYVWQIIDGRCVCTWCVARAAGVPIVSGLGRKNLDVVAAARLRRQHDRAHADPDRVEAARILDARS